MRIALCLLLGLSCGRFGESVDPARTVDGGGAEAGPLAAGTAADAGAGEAVDAGANDAGAVDAGSLSQAGQVRRLLAVHCAGCHTAGRGDAEPRFLDDADVFAQPSQRCPGRTVGACVSDALQNQAMEGLGCRTFILEPFHREAWRCMAASDIAVVVAWVAAGMPKD